MDWPRRFRMLLWRALRLRCPFCGRGRLFRHWLRMHACCETCGARFEREGGFFLGSIYFNYGLTALIIAVVYPLALFNEWASNELLLGLSLAFCLLFPIWFFRYARSLWLGFDQFVDPRPGEGGSSDPSPNGSQEVDGPASSRGGSDGSAASGGPGVAEESEASGAAEGSARRG